MGRIGIKKIIFTTKSLHHTTLVLICIRFTCPRCYSEGQEDGLAERQKQTTVRRTPEPPHDTKVKLTVHFWACVLTTAGPFQTEAAVIVARPPQV